jgi:DNA-binding beta-propeller fold protein YncE
MAPVPVGVHPFGVAVNPTNNKVYVSNYGNTKNSLGSHTIAVLDANSNSVIKTLDMMPDGQPTYVGIYAPNGAAGSRVYVPLHSTGVLAVLDSSTDTILRKIPVGAGAFGLAIDQSHGRIYVSSRGALWISELDVRNNANTIVRRIYLAGQGIRNEPYALAVDPALNRLYVVVDPSPLSPDAENPSEVWVYDLANLTTIPEAITPHGVVTIETGGMDGGIGIAVNPDTHHVFVANTQGDSVSWFDGATAPTNEAAPSLRATRLSQSSNQKTFSDPTYVAVDANFFGGLAAVYISNHHNLTYDQLGNAIVIIGDTAGGIQSPRR